MSKGMGRVERAIMQEITRAMYGAHPRPVCVSSWDVANDAYEPRPLGTALYWKPSRTQRQAAARAMHSFINKYPQYALMGGQGRKDLYLYEHDDPVSVGQAQKRCRGGGDAKAVSRLAKPLGSP
jgi:hypothetical protein